MKAPAYLILILLSSVLASCDSRTTDTLAQAGTNRKELLEVIDHYSNADSLHREAAIYFIANLRWHHGVRSIALDSIFSFIRESDSVPSDKCLEMMWEELAANDSVICIDDAKSLTSADIIDNIEAAFAAWEQAPWKERVGFDAFCCYILPHRVMDEEFSPGWREKLRREYAPVITGENDIAKAFAKVHNEVKRRFRNHPLGIPYIARLNDISSTGTGSCIQGCAYETAVMRALGLPAAIDYIHQWGNYSHNGHAWCALVLDDGTYTVAENDTIARIGNPIDAAVFTLRRPMPDGYPYTAEFRKRPLKIWRYSYESTLCDNGPYMGRVQQRILDVSADYGLTESIAVSAGADADTVWLCTHSITGRWIPQTRAASTGGYARFENIADSVLTLSMVMADGEFKPIGLPFYMSGGGKVEIAADIMHKQSAVFMRKYPISANWLNRYAQIPGTRIEGSNDTDFVSRDVLYVVSGVPVYHNSAYISSPHRYRYIRLIADPPSYINMDRIDIYGKDSCLLAADRERDFETVLDLGGSYEIGRIDYYPWNDGNFVKPGHLYELVYWDGDCWQSLGKKTSRGYSVAFDEIPSGALLMLHDRSEGKEERPFTLQGGRQVWW